jgi:hypothetical protein
MDRVDRGALGRYLLADVLAVLVFVAAGELQHGFPPHQFPVRFAGTAIPFLAGYLVVAPLVGAYAPRTRHSLRSAAGLALVAWLLADLVGQLVRSTAAFPGNADPVFYAVAAAFGALALLGGRVTAWLVAERR